MSEGHEQAGGDDVTEFTGFDDDVSEADLYEAEHQRGRRSFLRKLGIGTVGVGAVAIGSSKVAQAAGRGRGERRGDGPDQGGSVDQVQQAQTGDDGDGDGEGRRGDRRGGRRGRDNGDDGPGRFIRMFPGIEPFAEESPGLLEALTELGRPGGIMDADDPLEVGPVRLITEPDLSPNNRDNLTHTAGATFVGQFLDHDITRDAGSPLGRSTSVRRSVNLRTARFDLDSVYGGGPDESPELYERGDRFRLRIESGGQFEDVPRAADGSALIADPRNDENLIISGLHAAMLMFHNAVYDQVRNGRAGNEADFREARRLVRWHWQWLIVHEFLPQFVGQAMIDDIFANGFRAFRADRPAISVEFQTAAYRFGHSMIRPSYRANLAGDNGEAFFAMVFDPATFGQSDPDDLSGGHRAARRFIGWQTFFDFDDGEVKPNKRIDTSISTPLFQLPMMAIDTARGEPVGPTSLATRNLHRHVTWGLPSGQRVARELGVDVLAPGDLADVGQLGQRLDRSTPLWFYLLREADVVHDGLHLGPVGGRIVAETFIGLLQEDPTSYLASNASWTPTLTGGGTAGTFEMTDLLTIAGVDPTSRGQ